MWLHLCTLALLSPFSSGDGNLLQNPTLNLTHDPNDLHYTVQDWMMNNVNTIQPYPGTNAANFSFPGGSSCTQLYQIVPTVNGTRYRFACMGISQYDDISTPQGGAWANGLLVHDFPFRCENSASFYKNASFFSQFESQADPIWLPVSLEFTASSSSTLVILHADGGYWVCFTNCSLYVVTNAPTKFPTKSPTKTPTHSPTSIPTETPTQAPSVIPCVTCDVPSCEGLVIEKEASQCNTLTDLSQVVSWAQNISAAAETRSLICAIFISEAETNDCRTPLNRNLFIDVCAFLRNAIYSGFLANFDAKWCMNPTTNFSNTSLTVLQKWNTTIDINYTATTNQAPCLETQKYQSTGDSSTSSYQELGPLADVEAHPENYPNFPAIKKVSISQTTEILFNTACSKTAAVAPVWIGLLSAFLVVALLCLGLLFWRRKLQPVRARDSLLLWGGLFFIVVNFIWISIDQLTGNTTSCGLISFGNFVAFPMLLFVYLLRGLRLLFLYKWAESNVNQEAWFHAHRKLVSRNMFLLLCALVLGICLIIFMATNLADGTFFDTFISSGRCQWWDLNQQVIAAASRSGVTLLPTDFNPNGFVPFSVEYSSCVFCSTFASQVLMCIVTVLLLCTLVVTLILLRKINDQFKLWLELVAVLCVLIIVAIIRSIMFFPSTATLMMNKVGSDLSALFLAVALFLMLLISSLYPALMTFTFRFRVQPRPTSSNAMDGQMVIEGQTVTISLRDVLDDSFGLNLYTQFAVESFAVENVMFWTQFKEFGKYELDDPVRSDKVLTLYETFIRQGAPMEVNVEAPLRLRYDEMFGVVAVAGSAAPRLGRATIFGRIGRATMGGGELSLQQARSKATLPKELPDDIFADISLVVYNLMLTNCWTRFKRSPLWSVLTNEMKKRMAESNPIAHPKTQMSSFASLSRTE